MDDKLPCPDASALALVLRRVHRPRAGACAHCDSHCERYGHETDPDIRTGDCRVRDGTPAWTVPHLSGADSTLSGGVQLQINLATNTAYSVVTRYVVSSATSTLWLNPSSESEEGVTSTDFSPPINIYAYAFRQASGGGTVLIDDLKVGNSFSDVMGGGISLPVIVRQPSNQVSQIGSSVVFQVAVLS